MGIIAIHIVRSILKVRNEAREMLEDSWKDFVDKTRELNIGSESSSMNESLRAARQNIQQEILNSKNKEISRN